MSEPGYIKIWLLAENKQHLLASTKPIDSEKLSSIWWNLPVKYGRSIYIAGLCDLNGKVIDEVHINSRHAATLINAIHNDLLTSTTATRH